MYRSFGTIARAALLSAACVRLRSSRRLERHEMLAADGRCDQRDRQSPCGAFRPGSSMCRGSLLGLGLLFSALWPVAKRRNPRHRRLCPFFARADGGPIGRVVDGKLARSVDRIKADPAVGIGRSDEAPRRDLRPVSARTLDRTADYDVTVRHIIDLKCRSATQRLAAFLLRVADQNRGPGPAKLPIPKRRVAARIGISPETLSRSLQALVDHGLYLRGDQIMVRDREKVEQYCGGNIHDADSELPLGVYAL
jgi:hypothetical protein